jgi:hypothetical protein
MKVSRQGLVSLVSKKLGRSERLYPHFPKEAGKQDELKEG